MNQPMTSLTDIVYITISLKPQILRTDEHTERVFNDLDDPEHRYGRRKVDDAIRQRHGIGSYEIKRTTRDGFVVRWEGSQNVARKELDEFARSLLAVAHEIHRRRPSKGVAVTREEEYATGFRQPQYGQAQKHL
ncbi:MAG TPA: hypothetical protein VJH37_02040 [Candidatus Nanoarchaeia archaeon]|nr:hypothetical protein [Candidatus Nanoarchaeia archaeon]